MSADYQTELRRKHLSGVFLPERPKDWVPTQGQYVYAPRIEGGTSPQGYIGQVRTVVLPYVKVAFTLKRHAHVQVLHVADLRPL